jgi:acyl-CoA reductase-like NAD-dependent aldehyde dehydrogenase
VYSGITMNSFENIANIWLSKSPDISDHAVVRKVVFVDTTQTGQRVAISTTFALKHMGMELGRKPANIVPNDANLKHTFHAVKAAVFSSACHSLVAGSLRFVHSLFTPK